MNTANLKCEAAYHKNFLTEIEANTLLDVIINDYLFNEAFLQTKPNHLKVPALDKIMFMDEDLFDSNQLPNDHWGKTAPWFPELEALRNRIERQLQWPFHTGVCIYYPNGETGMDFHSDLPAFGSTDVIASISLGAERIFQLRDIESNKIHEELLHHGSLFVMGRGCQQNYEHALVQNSLCSEPRLNITFRTKGYNTQNLH